MAVTLVRRLVMADPATKSPVISLSTPRNRPLASRMGRVHNTRSSLTMTPSSRRNALRFGVGVFGSRNAKMRPGFSRFPQYARNAASSGSEKSYFGAMMKSALASGGIISTSVSLSGSTLMFWRSM